MARSKVVEVPKKEFSLPKGKVVVRPVVKSTYLIPDTNHRSAFLAPGAKNRYVNPIQRSTGNFKNVLTDEEKTYFESPEAGLDFKQGDLSIYKKVDNYWDEFSLLLGKEDYTLDLSNPIQYLEYKVLMANTEDIAPSLEALKKTKKATYKYVLINKEEEARVSSKSADLEESAWAHFGEIKNDRAKMFNVLRVDGKKPSAESSDDFLKSLIKEMLKANTRGFLEIVTDPNLETKITIQEALAAKILSTKGGAYFAEGGEKLGNSLFDAAEYLTKPENQELLLVIENKLGK